MNNREISLALLRVDTSNILPRGNARLSDQERKELFAASIFAQHLRYREGRDIKYVTHSPFQNDFDCGAIENQKRIYIEVTELDTKSRDNSDLLWLSIKNKLDCYYASHSIPLILLVYYPENVSSISEHFKRRNFDFEKMEEVARSNLNGFECTPFSEIWFERITFGNRHANATYVNKVW